MKIRNGFVSNSSSSSFLIYGIAISTSEINEALQGKDSDDYDIWKEVEKLLSGTGIDFHLPYGDDTYYIGISWSEVKDDETGRQFKERVQKSIYSAFNTLYIKSKLECSTHEAAWHS